MAGAGSASVAIWCRSAMTIDKADSVATELWRCRLRICRITCRAPEVSWYRSMRLPGSWLRRTHPRLVHLVSSLSASQAAV
jgi:hypothetical protein